MAAERLILRSILYGADKIPDSWFEKLPGGYYRDSEATKRKARGQDPKKNDQKTTSTTRKAKTSDFQPEQSRASRGRERHRDRCRGRSTSSFDGGADDDDYYYYRDDGRPYRSKSRRRPRSVDDNKNGYNDGHRRDRYEKDRQPRQRYHDDRHRGAPSSAERDPEFGRRRSAAYLERPPDRVEPRSLGTDRFGSTRARGVHHGSEMPLHLRDCYSIPEPTQLPPPPIYRNGPISNGYVPYAHIYGTGRQAPPPQESSPGTFFDPEDLRARGSPLAPNAQGFSESQFAQQVPPAVNLAEGHANQYAGNYLPYPDAPSFSVTPFPEQEGLPSSRRYKPRGDNQRHRSERRGDAGSADYSKSRRYADSDRQFEPQRHREDGNRSDLDGKRAFGRSARVGRRSDYYPA